jgi:hydroxymethylpyrimidine pyrophosphatase-like HAD family hydrolase
MRYFTLACDYDDTIASAGRVSDACWRALERWVAAAREVVLVTGRELDQLRGVCPRLDLFARVVAENGAVLLNPRTGVEEALGEAPPAPLVATLRERGVSPLSVGRVIVATREPHQAAVARALRALGLKYQIILNKGAVMVLPLGIDKATGLAAALAELGTPADVVVGVGDAENDRSFLASCGLSAAVANALASVRAEADVVTEKPDGAGVAELIDRLLREDPG